MNKDKIEWLYAPVGRKLEENNIYKQLSQYNAKPVDIWSSVIIPHTIAKPLAIAGLYALADLPTSLDILLGYSLGVGVDYGYQKSKIKH